MAMRKRGKMWVADYYDNNGERIIRKLSPFEETARPMYNDLIRLRDAEKSGTPILNMSWFAFRERYLLHRKAMVNHSTYCNDARAFDMVERYGTPLLSLEQMTPEYLQEFWVKAKTHKDKPLPDRTISGYCRVIKTAMHQARRWRLTAKLDWEDVKCLADNKREDYLTYPEFVKVLESAEGPFKRAAWLMGWAGLRRGEVLHLDWSDVDFKERIIHVRAKYRKGMGPLEQRLIWAPKGSKPGKIKNRKVDMAEPLEAFLKELPERKGLVIGPEPIDEDDFSEYFRKLGKRLGLVLFPHKFRHTCGTFLASNGVTPKVIGELFGHHDQRSSDVYSHIMPHARRQAMDQMGNGMKQTGAQ